MNEARVSCRYTVRFIRASRRMLSKLCSSRPSDHKGKLNDNDVHISGDSYPHQRGSTLRANPSAALDADNYTGSQALHVLVSSFQGDRFEPDKANEGMRLMKLLMKAAPKAIMHVARHGETAIAKE